MQFQEGRCRETGAGVLAKSLLKPFNCLDLVHNYFPKVFYQH